MRASVFEFRFAVAILLVVLAVGFWSPGVHGPTVWMLLAGWLSHQHWLTIRPASLTVGYAAALLALLAAWLRTWAAAYVGSRIVSSRTLHADRVVTEGPYRYFRHPIYVGSEMHLCALGILMPLYGAVFVIVCGAILFYRLALLEESRLSQHEAYRAYSARVRRFGPSLLSADFAPAQPARPRWGQAFLGEIYCWGATASFFLMVPQYNALRILQGVGVSFGAYLIVKALWPAQPSIRAAA